MNQDSHAKLLIETTYQDLPRLRKICPVANNSFANESFHQHLGDKEKDMATDWLLKQQFDHVDVYFGIFFNATARKSEARPPSQNG